MYDLVFDCGEHALKLLGLGRDHIRTQVGISSDGPKQAQKGNMIIIRGLYTNHHWGKYFFKNNFVHI